MEVLLLLIRLFLTAIFLLAGIGKLLDLKGSEKAVKAFGTPDEMAKTMAIALPFAEIVFGVCFLFTATSWLGAVGGFLLLASFIGGMIWQIAQGKSPDCHCFGAIHSEPVSKKSLIRNIIFAALALFLVLQGRDQGASLAELPNEVVLQLFFGLATVGLLGAAIFYLKRISEQQTQIIRRIEVLEVLSHEDGRAVEHKHLSEPKISLPIGAPAPDFALPDLGGRQVAFEHLLGEGKPMLFFYLSPNCGPCKALVPEIEIWQKELEGKMSFVFLSSGNLKENQKKFAGSFKKVLLQQNNEIADLFGAQWTPTAWVVNSDGMIASALAVGDKSIRDLVEDVKAGIDRSAPLLIAPAGENSAESAPIGQNVPEFSLPDTTNRNITTQDLLGRKTLMTFWSMSCGFCTQMIEDLREWDRTRGVDEPNLLLISDGEAEKHSVLELQSPILLDQDRKFSQRVGMKGTPSAVLINENGKIVSETAVGAEQIWRLIGRKK